MRESALETLLTSDELAERVGLKTRQSVHDWLKKGRIVGWRGARRGHVFASGQFDERGRPFDGFDRVTELFDDGYAPGSGSRRNRPRSTGRSPPPPGAGAREGEPRIVRRLRQSG